jgi:WhiB family redox-sensing transcriptional regulator
MDITTIPTGPNLPGALCAQSDPESWHPEKGANNHYAKKICNRCPVKTDCLNWALATGQPDGIWGATTPRERQTMRRTGASHA